MPRQGYLWPIQVVFLTFLIVGTIGLLDPRFFNKTQPMPLWVSVVLLVIATSAAILLYLPPVTDILRGCGSLRRIDDLIRSPQAVQAVGEMRLNLQRLVDRVGDPIPSVSVEIQRINARLDAISAGLAAIRGGAP